LPPSWQALAARFSRAKVDPDLIYVRDGRLITGRGVTAGIDLGLALVGQRHGAETALKVAKRLVAPQQSAMSWQKLIVRALANGSVLNIIIEKPSAEGGGVCDFAIALFEVFIF
jgi:transcriptional regulator GlxA family with amidase domain